MAKIFSKSKVILLLIILIASFLRLYRISEIPVSLFGDELDVGYHAYSILKTGRDYQGNFMPIHFHSLAEWRTPLYLYSSVPTVAIFGISPLGVRLPAAIFGILGVVGLYLVVKELLSYGSPQANFHPRALLAAFLLAINPWHIQYSRAGFEVTELLAFLFFGLYFFFRALRSKGNGIWLAVVFLTFTPWIYSTAKLFTPLLLGFLFLSWRKEILDFPLKRNFTAAAAGLIIGIPIAISTVFGGGAERAGYTSVFTDPTVTSEIGNERMRDLLMRNDAVELGSKPSVPDRFFHNKLTEWEKVIAGNYLQSFSFDFLFSRGDPNPRHSPQGMGEFYKVDFIVLIIGLILFFSGKNNVRIKQTILFWLIAGALPAALTRDGGNHATRLILILPPLLFLISFGIIGSYRLLGSYRSNIFLGVYSAILCIYFIFYLHIYYIHYPWDSERWWHAGFKESIQSIKEIDKDYDKVIISMAGEPAWIFFAGWYEYPPLEWQNNFPIGHDTALRGFGKVSYTGKFYFGNFNTAGESIYDLGKYIDNKTLYLAVAKEMGVNLIMEPERTPPDLKLVKAIPYPSGEPAYYLFTKN